jgi:hypothetical protein
MLCVLTCSHWRHFPIHAGVWYNNDRRFADLYTSKTEPRPFAGLRRSEPCRRAFQCPAIGAVAKFIKINGVVMFLSFRIVVPVQKAAVKKPKKLKKQAGLKRLSFSTDVWLFVSKW